MAGWRCRSHRDTQIFRESAQSVSLLNTLHVIRFRKETIRELLIVLHLIRN